MVDRRVAPAVSRMLPTTRYGFQWPKRVISAPTPTDDSRSPAIIGIVMRPASVGVAPRAICMYWPRKTDAPNIAMPVAIEATTARVKVRSRKRVSGTSGSLVRSSTTTNSTAATRAPPTMRMVSVPHQSKLEPALVTQMSSSETAVDSSTMPR